MTTLTQALPDPVQRQLERFISLLEHCIAQESLVKLVLAKYKGPEADLVRVAVRRIMLRDEPHLSFVYSHATRDVTRNLSLVAGIDAVRDMLGSQFRNAQLTSVAEDVQLAFSKKGKCTLRVGKSTQTDAPEAGHNREKHRFLELDRPFLVELGVTNEQHQLVPAMARKWKQINKFIEVFSHALSSSALARAEQIRVTDFGSGKGYLTFAIHDYLSNVIGAKARVTGVELRDDMVRLCTAAVKKLGLEGLQFDQGDVRTYAPAPLDVMIALHACDVATDYAIHLGIRRGASIIMCSPCCHKQVRPQLLSPHPLRPILQHGIHLGQEAEMLTDGLRALLLEVCGYDTQVFEFISLEHTNKNKMILAVKRSVSHSNAEVLQQIEQIKAFYGIKEQCLESLLQADGLLAPH